MKFFILFAAVVVFSSCGTTENIEIAEEPVVSKPTDEVIKPERNVKIKAKIGKFVESDPLLSINSTRVEGNLLFIEVSFSGGCAEHNFQVLGSPMLMKSLPPKRAIQIVHKNNGDSCRSIVTKILEVDITELAANNTPGSEVVLVLDGVKEEISYIYQ